MCCVRWPQTSGSLCSYRTILTFLWPLSVNENTHSHTLSDRVHNWSLWVWFGCLMVNMSSVHNGHSLKWWKVQIQIKTLYLIFKVNASAVEIKFHICLQVVRDVMGWIKLSFSVFLYLPSLCAFPLFPLHIFFAELLEQVHAIGKASKNIFSAAQNFSFSGDGDASPVISFKAHLIRLIGNLCHSNTNNQNKVWNNCVDEKAEKAFTPVVWFSFIMSSHYCLSLLVQFVFT